MTLTELANAAVGGLPMNIRALNKSTRGPWTTNARWLRPYLARMAPVTQARVKLRYQNTLAAQGHRLPDLLQLAGRAVRLHRMSVLVKTIETLHRRQWAAPLVFAAQLGASLGAAPLFAERALLDYALALGRATALRAEVCALRQPQGAFEGQISHPLAVALARLSGRSAQRLLAAIEADDWTAVQTEPALECALAHSEKTAEVWVERAAARLEVLPPSAPRLQLMELANRG